VEGLIIVLNITKKRGGVWARFDSEASEAMPRPVYYCRFFLLKPEFKKQAKPEEINTA